MMHAHAHAAAQLATYLAETADLRAITAQDKETFDAYRAGARALRRFAVEIKDDSQPFTNVVSAEAFFARNDADAALGDLMPGAVEAIGLILNQPLPEINA